MSDFAQMITRQRVLADFGDLAQRSESLDEILTEACRLVSEALGTTRAKVLEIEYEGRSLLVRAGVGWKPDVVGRLRLEMREHSSETFSIKLGKPVVTQDIRQEDRFEVPAFLRDAGVVALVNVPIFLPGGRAYGLLQVDATEPRDFGQADMEFLRTYATILGPVIDRLRKVSRLQTTEERFRVVVENALDYAIFVTDAEDRIIDWMPGAAAVFGWSAEEAVGQPSSIIFTPEDRANHVDQDEVETARREGVAPNRRWHLRKDGTRVFIDGTVKALRGDGGEVRGFLKIGQDVTERRRVEEQLRESEARQRALIEGLPQLVWRSAADGEWTWAGPQWSAYTSLSSKASQGHGWLAALHPNDRGAALEAWREGVPDGVVQLDCRIRHAASGHYAWFQMRGTPVREGGGHVAEWIGSCTDIDAQIRARDVLARSHEELEALVAARTAELMAAEGALRQAQKMEAVGQLTGGIAHDFNNMLQGVAGAVNMARRRVADGRADEAGRYLDAARDATGRAAGLTRRLLAFARRQRLDPKVLEPDALAASMADLVRRTVGPGVELRLEVGGSIGSVLCDPNELESALLNLCINARDAMPEGGRLTIGTKDVRLSATEAAGYEGILPRDYTAISVSDTGTGMTPEVLKRVFEPFFTTKPLGQGTGLGLSQVYGFARQSGGLVQVESTPGSGTTVRVLLPRHERAAPASEKRTAAIVQERVGAGAAVLLVDDEAAVRGPAAERLRELDYQVIEAADGPAALGVLAEGGTRVDLLVTDVGLPNGMNGRQVAEAAREQRPGLLVLFITGYAGTTLPPGIEVIDKPFELDTLVRRVQELLEAGPQTDERNPGA
jgi:PAS domain S-box-containing protein